MKKLIMLMCCLGAWSGAQADLVYIVNSANADNIDTTAANNIFLGKTKTFPAGGKAIAVSIDYNEAGLEGFLSQKMGKTLAQFRAYWSKMVFAGQGLPPQLQKTSEEVVEVVSRNPDAIGIADNSATKGKVRIVN